MPIPPIPVADLEWLRIFFGERNALQWSQIVKGEADPERLEEVLSCLQLLARDDDRLPVILPLYTNDGATTWYACARSAQSAAQLVEELDCFIGETYTNLDRRTCHFDSNNPIGAALRTRFGQWIYCFSPLSIADEKPVKRLLQIYRVLLNRRPERSEVGVRPVGRVLSDFERALANENELHAEKYLEELKTSGRLNAENQKFLEIRFLAATGKWREIALNNPLLRTVADLNLPTRILSDVVEAIYKAYLEQFETRMRCTDAVKEFREQVGNRYGRLFRTRKGICTPAVIKTFLIHELAKSSPSPIVCQSLVDSYPSDATDRRYVQALARLAPAKIIKDNLSEAEQAFEDENYDLALNLFLQCPPSSQALRRILACARDIESLEASRKALEAARNYPTEIIQALPKVSAGILQELEKRFSTKVAKEESAARQIADWCDWAEWTVAGADLEVAERLARQGATEWPVEKLSRAPSQISRFAQILGSENPQVAPLFHRLFPTLFDYFSSPSAQQSAFRPIYLSLITLIALDEVHSNDDLDLEYQLVKSVLDAGLSSAEYRDVVADLKELWQGVASVRHLNWGLDVAELLVTYPAPEHDAPLSFYLTLLETAQKNRHRLSDDQWKILESLARDFSSEEFIEQIKPSQESDRAARSVGKNASALINKLIGIYTLTESAGARAKEILETMYPGVEVSVNSDSVATDRLRKLAETADVFVFAWRSSKHQAFYCIKDHRPRGKDIIAPEGKGSASIVRSVVSYVSNFEAEPTVR